MKRLESYLGEFGSWLAWLFLWCGSGALIAILVGRIEFPALQRVSTKLWGIGVFYAFAVAYFFAGCYFFILIIRAHGRRGQLVREGPIGEIQVSLWAIAGLVRQTLRQEMPAGRFRIKLTRLFPQAIKIRVRAELPGHQSVVRVSEEIQRLLKERVEERTGVEVEKVEVLVGGIFLARRAESPEGGRAP
ncbi:MAG: alkaline shock response membrane anchor protein AmaP [Candidatus Acetothermia bacterium]|jgi:hypothetical protein|nr:alkaline shock response membrane anchor protein AmaP [Candidatus Acetothermia bacterium]MDH7505815.1 alkaline shock response membrane anchor protein AmaP [Candidatus Acetothermia bacterium]